MHLLIIITIIINIIIIIINNILISSASGEDRESAFLFQRISVNIQRFNSVLLHDSFAEDVPVNESLHHFCF